MKKAILALSIAGILTGCGGDEQTIDRPDNTPRSLTYSYPADAQTRTDGSHQFATTVPASSPMYLRFTKAVTTPEEELADKLTLTDEHGNTVDISTVMLTSENKGIAVTAVGELDHGTTYSLQAEGLEVGGTAINLTDDGIVFRTAPGTDGPMLGRTEGEGFQVARVIPVGGDQYPITDFTVPRIQLTEPVDESSLVYGDTISLRDSEGELVPAEVYVKHHRITVDPDDYLSVGEEYTLTLTDGVKSALLGSSLTANELSEWSFTPVKSTSPTGKRQIMAQQAQKQEGEHSITKAGLNSVNLASTLLGPDNPTTATGTVFAELAYIPQFEANDQNVPLSIGRGALMTSESVQVKVAGAVPAGFESEEVYVRFLSDANGFLSGNPFTDYSGAPRTVELYIDMALNTENTIANSALGQELMHVQLVGTAMVVDGLLNIEAVGVIEPDVMGVDQATGLISFKLEGFRSSADAPDQATVADNIAPFIKSWAPGESHQDKLLPEDPVIFYFNEPVLPSTVSPEAVSIRASGDTLIDTQLILDGSSLVVRPTTPWQRGDEYSVTLASSIKDLSGNNLTETTVSWSLPATNQSVPSQQAPLLVTSLPGYPCAKNTAVADPTTQNHQGRCIGGKSSDDQLPITSHPSDRPIIARFSQQMDTSTISAGDTFVIEKFNGETGSWEAFSDYSISTTQQQLTVTPLNGWDRGDYFKYTLSSNIRSQANLRLQSQFLSQSLASAPTRTGGGPDIVNYFKAGPSNSDRVLTPLRNLPTADVNASLSVASPEQGVTSEPYEVLPNSARVLVAQDQSGNPQVSSGLVSDAQVGCRVDQQCNDKKFIYKTAMLDVEVTGTANEAGQIPVNILPSLIAASGLNTWVYASVYDTTFWDNPILYPLVRNYEADQKIPTGPMFLRMRYEENGDQRDQPIPGLIYSNESGELTFETTLDLYLDAPYLDAELPLTSGMDHNLRSYPLNDVTVKGPVTFLDDGRMQISLKTVNPINLDVQVRGTLLADVAVIRDIAELIAGGSPDTDMRLTIPAGDLFLNYISPYTQQ